MCNKALFIQFQQKVVSKTLVGRGMPSFQNKICREKKGKFGNFSLETETSTWLLLWFGKAFDLGSDSRRVGEIVVDFGFQV